MTTRLRGRLSVMVAGVVASALGTGCGQEDRDFREIPPALVTMSVVACGST